MRLISTKKNWWLGSVHTWIDDNGDYQFDITDPTKQRKCWFLIDDDEEPIYIANAYMLDQLVDAKKKDVSQKGKALLSFFKFLKANKLKWNDTTPEVERNNRPIFQYQAKLAELVENGCYKDKVAAGYLSHIRGFYMFCRRHNYVDKLPFNITGYTAYGDPKTDCYIQVRHDEQELRPLSEYHLKLLFQSWYVVSPEVRLGILMSLFIGLREVEVGSMPKKLFQVPKGFTGRNAPDVPIGPRTGVHTKGGVDRKTPIPVWLIELMNKYHSTKRYRDRAQMYKNMYDCGDDQLPALLDHNGEMYTTKTLTSLWSKITAEIRKSDPHYQHKWHDCRCTYGCATMDAYIEVRGLSRTQALALLRKNMGHLKQTTTLLYLEFWENDPHTTIIADVMGDFVEMIIENLGL
ncbi:hypothetical protein [Thaumasiovibrio sp. DFM-14]|uniref:hypothetical protein n=1 Tax=Thaumasiovibrio sp. DFM-14 TaxID=3384792 RepID=UPI0039A24613